MSASRYTNKIRARVEANEKKVQQPGRIVNPLPLLSANGCSADYSQLDYKIRCSCRKFLPIPTRIFTQRPSILDTNSGAHYQVTFISGSVYYFIINTNTNIVIENSTVRNAVIVGPGGPGGNGFFAQSGSSGTITTLTSAALNNNTNYTIQFDPFFVSIGAVRSYYGITPGLPGVNGATNSIGRGVGGNAGLIIGGLPPLNINAYSGSGYGAGGGGQTTAGILGGGGEGGFNPDLYFGVNGLNSGMPTSTITTNGSPGVVIFALQ